MFTCSFNKTKTFPNHYETLFAFSDICSFKFVNGNMCFGVFYKLNQS